MNIVILAAGQGKRMHSSVPKVLHEIAGKSLLGHVLNTANALRPQKLCVVYGHGGETVKAAFTNDANDTSAQSLAWALQAPQLGTGHAVQQALPHLKADGTTLILYGDVPLIGVESLQKLVHAGRNALGILTIKLDNPSGYGRIVRNAAGQVQRIVEHKDASPEELAIDEINTGIMAMPSAQLVKWLKNLSNNNAQQEYYLTDIVHMAAQENFPIATASPQHAWEVEGVNSQLQLARLERVFQAQQADKLLENGVHLLDPARFDVRGELICGRDVSIDVNCVFEGRVELADGVRIASHCVIKNAQIGVGTQIAAFSHIEDARVGAQAKIGPFARLRPGASLAENVHIGNFVEIKKSTIAAYSKVNHLAYIGDALIGERVNVGAGTITCNYDGVNKFQTIIEDDVFIGSDTQLVAPVKVGRGATLGAGTTLTKDAPPGALTVARARQITLSNWKRPLKVTKKV